MNATERPGPRARLLDAAQELLYQQGANVGIDAILKRANVARRSLYEHFGGKDELVAEVLRVTSGQDLARYREVMAAAGDDPRTRLLAVFADLETVIAEPGFRGCRYLAADLALVSPEHPAHEVTRRYRQQVHALLAHELQRLGHRDPDLAADQIHLLIEGTLSVGATRPASRPASGAMEMAKTIIDAN